MSRQAIPVDSRKPVHVPGTVPSADAVGPNVWPEGRPNSLFESNISPLTLVVGCAAALCFICVGFEWRQYI